MTPELPNMLCFILISILSGLTGIPAVDFEIQPADVTKVCVRRSSGTTGSSCSLEFECKVSSPQLATGQTLSWIINRVIISDGNTFRSSDNHPIDRDRYNIFQIGAGHVALLVNSVSLSTAEIDSGTYQCAVTGSNGIIVPDGRSRTAHANIYVLDSTAPSNKPICHLSDSRGQDIPQTSYTLVMSGDSYTLTCLARVSNSQAQSIWYRNYPNGMIETPVNEMQQRFIYNTYYWVPASSDGSTLQYTCVLKQPGLSQSQACSISFNIQYAPRVTINPTDVMVTEDNDEIVLHCNQDANPQVTETVWYYDDDVVNSDGRFTLEGMSLHIIGFSPKDNGNHTIICQLTNAIGTGRDGVMLTVDIQYAPIVTIDPTDVMVTEENGEIVLHCNQDANPQVTEPVWYYDNDVVNSGGRFSQEGMSLRILGFSPSDNGDHTIICQLTNAIGTGRDGVMLTVDIQYAPIVTIDPTDVMVTEENGEIVLHCNQDANPQVTETVWYYDDDVVNVVNGSSRFIIEGMSLRILNLHPRDNGVHLVTCKATNEEGTGNASASITVSIPLPMTEPSTQSSSTTMSTIGSSQGHRPTTPKGD
ncbi:cell adhesion molecule 4-like [Ptychodera flava]|uniref:cell adhesion molecule 4-like n=1 Tax=Ptychodera flava TaxID=63121 RepID=UPI00396A2B5C